MPMERARELESWAAGQPATRRAITQPLPSLFSPALSGAAEVVALVRRLADGQERDDLVQQLDDIRTQLQVQPVPVVVIGGPGQGKSSLVNALVGASICPVAPAGGTVAPVHVAHAPEYGGSIVLDTRDHVDGAQIRDVGFGEAALLADAVMNPDNTWRLRQVELGVPSPTLARGLVLIDTPPVHEVWTPATMRTLRAVSGAAAVILVTGASGELTTGELDLARVAAAFCHRVIVAVNGTRSFPEWASIVERDQLLLEQRGVPARTVAVDTSPYWGDAGGVPPGPDPGLRDLAAHLEQAVVLDIEHQRISKALVEAFWAADRLRMRLHAERTLIGDGQGIEAAGARLRGAAQGAQELCGPGAAWRLELDDGVRDLRRDIAHDLDTELARLTAEAEAQVATIGAGATWEEVHVHLHRRIADAIVHVQRVRKLALRGTSKRVADQFQRDWTRIVSGLDLASEAHALLNPRLDRPSLAGTRSFRDLPLGAPDPRPVGSEPGAAGPAAGSIDPLARLDPTDTRAVALAGYREWLAVAASFLRADDQDTVPRVAAELEGRCQSRGIELHRSIVEVFTTLNVLRHLDPESVLQRHEALENDLEQLQSLDFQLHPVTPQPKLGY